MYTITGVAVLALVIAYLIPNPDKLKKGAPAASVEAVQAVATSEASQGAEPRL